MQKLHLLIPLCMVFISCEKQWDDPIPEGAELGTPRLVAEITEEGEILLSWNFSMLCVGWMCPPTVEGSRYEVYAILPGSEEWVRIAQLGAEDNSFLFHELEFGEIYEFNVKAFRAGHMTTSNQVMVVPSQIPEYETLMELEDWDPLIHPKISPNGDKVAYISNYRWSVGTQDYMALSLFLHDLGLDQKELIKINCYHPQWSRDGRKVIYGTTEGLQQSEQGHSPSQLETYDVGNKTIDVLRKGFYQQLFPRFNKEDNRVIYLSDSLKRGEMGLWRSEISGSSQVIWPSFPFPAHGAGMSLVTGMDVSGFKDIVVLDIIGNVENRTVYNIHGVEFGENIDKMEIMVSRWNDRAPAFSPFADNHLAFISDRSGSNQVWTLDLSNGNLKQVSFFQDEIRISTSGTSLSWTDQGQALVVPISTMGGVQQLVKLHVAS